MDDETFHQRIMALIEQWGMEDKALFQELAEKRRAMDERRHQELMSLIEQTRQADAPGRE